MIIAYYPFDTEHLDILPFNPQFRCRPGTILARREPTESRAGRFIGFSTRTVAGPRAPREGAHRYTCNDEDNTCLFRRTRFGPSERGAQTGRERLASSRLSLRHICTIDLPCSRGYAVMESGAGDFRGDLIYQDPHPREAGVAIFFSLLSPRAAWERWPTPLFA